MPDSLSTYVERQLRLYQQTDSQNLKYDALYRAGTAMEVLECNANAHLTPEQRQTVLDA